MGNKQRRETDAYGATWQEPVSSDAFSSPMAFCNVVIRRTRLDALTYHYDPATSGELHVGDCVQVTLRGRKVQGIVTEIIKESEVKKTLPVLKLLERSLVSQQLLLLFRRVAKYYWARLGEVLKVALPPNIGAYRTRRTRDVDTSQLVVCEDATDRSSVSEVRFQDNRFRVFFTFAVALNSTVEEFLQVRGRQGGVIILLPIEKLRDWKSCLHSRFGQRVVEYHHEMSEAQRKRAWQQIRNQHNPLVLGVRSAVFVPVQRLSGVVVVEEHSPRFKEERHPAYHARDVAIARARVAECPVLLCDYTPSLETWYNLKAGVYVPLGTAIAGDHSARVFVVDMNLHREGLFSERLRREMAKALEGGSVILYMNRQGLSRYVVCTECGCVLQCKQCNIPLVLYADQTMVCSLCGAKVPAPECCPNCQGYCFELRAPGIEMLVREVRKLFPRARVEKVSERGKLPSALPAEPGTVFVGAQALLYRSWPSTTRLVAAVRFDYDLMLPDFRSQERAFQTLYEMVYRAKALGSKLLVQTWRPDNPAVRCAVEQDLTGFLEQELQAREQIGFPPVKRLALIELSGKNERACRHAERVSALLSQYPGLDTLGPVSVRSGLYRLLVKIPRSTSLDRLITPDQLSTPGVEVRVDIDPMRL